MIFTYKQLTDHNRTFFEEMVDLKVTGWNTFSRAMNAYTFNFYKDQLKAMDEAVDKLASDMKGFGNE
tara:strand:- start:369 stop:569 length:201 start_codon:yes stop_codon:yes gene_type:complete